MKFFTSAVEFKILQTQGRKQGPDDDRVLVYDVTVEVTIPDLETAKELDLGLAQLLFGAPSNLFKGVTPNTATVNFSRQDLHFWDFKPKSVDEDDMSFFLEGATVKAKKLVPYTEDAKCAKMRLVLGWRPDSIRDAMLLHEHIDNDFWVLATEYAPPEDIEKGDVLDSTPSDDGQQAA